jgi:SNARE protein
MSEDLASYETDLVVVEKDIRQSFDAVHQLEGDGRADKLQHIASRLYHAKQLLQTLRLEVNEAPVDTRAQWQAQVSQHASALQRYDNLYIALRNDTKRQDLLDGRVADADSMTPAQLIQHAARVQEDTVISIGRSKHMVDSAREVGTFTADQLRKQTEQMQQVDTNIKDMSAHFSAAQGQLRAIAKRLETDKCLLGMLAFILLGVVVILAYKSIFPNARLNAPKGFTPPIGYE